MLTNVKTPHEIFYNPQRLLVPLFQRPYVWNREMQWQPLWDDVRRVSERILKGLSPSHFLGAVVLQQMPHELGNLSARSVIDGQQRLTTLQLFFDAIHSQFVIRDLSLLAERIQSLVENPTAFRQSDEDAFKIWPTNRDRGAFNEVMSAPNPVEYSKLSNSGSRMAEAHKFFSAEVGSWLDTDASEMPLKAEALFDAISRHLQVVVIDLQFDEDAQEIFETLNARGTPLTAADLIKNFVFQRLEATPSEAEKAYHEHWAFFETPFWEQEINAGRLLYTRSSLFLTQWLVAQLGEEITAREVFNRFKHYIEDLNQPVEDLLPRLHRCADVYREIVERSKVADGPLTRVEQFLYRGSALDSQVFIPIVIWLTDPDLAKIPDEQLDLAVESLESWMVRRAIIRAQTKSYNKLVLDLLAKLKSGERTNAGNIVREFLASQSSINTYWPTDDEVRNELSTQPVYRRLTRARLRMLLESLEDARRGFGGATGGKFSEGPITRGSLSIEHVMPQEWRTNWGDSGDEEIAAERDNRVHNLGNLTLVTPQFNSRLSNDAWATKKAEIKQHSHLKITSEIVDRTSDWTDLDIDSRSIELASQVVSIWSVPAGNIGLKEVAPAKPGSRITVGDLVSAELLAAGQTLFCRTQAHLGHPATIGEDGGIFVDGVRYETPSAAAKAVTKSVAEDGWWFWVVDLEDVESLGDLRKKYMSMTEADELVDEAV